MRFIVRLALWALLCTTATAQAAQIDCAKPEVPVVPDGATATEADLAEAGAAVRTFIEAGQGYLACLEEKEAAYGDAITAEQQSLINAIYNATVETMETAAAQYNEAIGIFRAREDG